MLKLNSIFVLSIQTVLLVTFLLVNNGVEAAPKRSPCDPKFGLTGNYIELSLTPFSDGDSGVQICFDSKDPTRDDHNCLQLEQLPGRFRSEGQWTSWAKGRQLGRKSTVYQYGLCGSKNNESLWHDFHRHLSTDAWDYMRLRKTTPGLVELKGVRVVQNRVRILDNERFDEGKLSLLLGPGGVQEVDLRDSIRQSKINRIACLNTRPGLPYCDEVIDDLDPKALPAVVEIALLELGHSGSKKYYREDDAWCSEFALFVISQSTNLSRECATQKPDPAQRDLNASNMYKWFNSCGRIIKNGELKAELSPGDYVSVHDRKHSSIFLGWAGTGKAFFWEISGNNQCRPELESMVATNYMNNMVCIAKREFHTAIRSSDFGGRTGN